MLNKSICLYFVVFFIGFIVFSPVNRGLTQSDTTEALIKLENVQHLADHDVRSAELYLPYITKYIENGEISIPLVLAVMKAESNFQIEARSHKGALGLMQLMPRTALEEYQKSGLDAPLHKIKSNLLSQPELNIALGVRHLKGLQARLEGIENPDKARKLLIASYNAGVHRVKRAFKCKGFNCYKYKANKYSNRYFKRSINSLPAETRSYLQNVEYYYKKYKKAFEDQKLPEDFTT